MSINVTVNGNPVKIKRDKMVTTDPDYAKKELDRRRKIRLAQVRQQSSEIAAKVRERVQKERDDQLSEIEKQGAEKLERWKLRKLLELQEQYCDSLKNLGLGHAQAAEEETREKVVQASKEALREKTKQRGYQAAKKLHEGQRENLKEKSPEKARKSAEKAIQVLKSPFKRKKKRKKVSSKNASKTKCPSDSDFTITENNNPDLDYYNSDTESFHNNSHGEQEPESKSPSEVSSLSEHSEDQAAKKMEAKLVAPSLQKSIESEVSTPRSPSPPKLADIIIHHPPDTRISDRIKNRRLPSFRDPTVNDAFPADTEVTKDPTKVLVSMGTLTDDGQVCPCCYKCHCKKRSLHETKGSLNNVDKMVTSKNVATITDADLFPLQIHTVTCDCCTCKNKIELPAKESKRDEGNKESSIRSDANKCNCQSEIPSKPTVVLKGAQKSKLPDSDKVQYYDHANRFTKQYLPTDNQVQQIPESDIEIMPTTHNEKEQLEKMRRRDKEAQIRGKKALEKIKIQKDYKELLEKLPALQRQERIASINTKNRHNPAFHMSDSRLKEQEQKKQCRMEDAYEKLCPRTITLKPKTHNVNDKPFRVIDTTNNSVPPPFYWDVGNEEKGGVVVTKDDGIIVIDPDGSDQVDNLKCMLEKLKKQKEMLMKEVETLPRDSNLNNIISDLEKFQNTGGKQPATPPGTQAKSFDQSELLDRLTKSNGLSPSHRRKSSKQSSKTATSSGDSSKHRKKCYKTHRIILQNTSTQTSSKVILSSYDQSKERNSVHEKPEKEEIHEKMQTKSGPVETAHTLIPPGTSTKSLSSSKITLCGKSDTQRIHDKLCKCCPSCERSGVCEIVIKIHDDIPEINIKNPTKASVEAVSTSSKVESMQLKSLAGPAKIQNTAKPYGETTKNVIPAEHKSKAEKSRKLNFAADNKEGPKLSWGKTLKLTSPEASTSTSYYTPPDFKTSESYLSFLLSKTKRKEVLLKNIKKLLNMSRSNIDTLGVSTDSEMSVESAISALSDPSSAANLEKLLNLGLHNIKKHANKVSVSASTAHAVSKAGILIDYTESVSSSETELLEDENVSKDVHDGRLAAVAERYQCVADRCQERISNLAAMIEQVRKEKEQILSPTFSDKEPSTTYLNLPSTLGDEGSKSPSVISGNASDAEQTILNKLLLDVNITLDKTKNQHTKENDLESDRPSSIDPETYARYKNLLDVEAPVASKSDVPLKDTLIIPEIRISNTEQCISIMDIPRLPELKHSQSPQNGIEESHKVKKPPPARGLSAAKKFNGDITNTPHELSTIVEVDSQLSTKVPTPQKRDKQDAVTLNNIAMQFAMQPRASEEKLISEESMPDIVPEIRSTESSSSTSDSMSIHNEKQQTDRSISSDMDNLEAMLVSMGMGWAVATLRKTQEAFTKTASSTSSDDKKNSKGIADSSTSDVTLRDILGKKIFSTSTTISTSQSVSPFLRELEEISEIQGFGLSIEHRKCTSTPVDSNMDKSAETSKKKNKKVEISTETDISSKATDGAYASVPLVDSPNTQKKS